MLSEQAQPDLDRLNKPKLDWSLDQRTGSVSGTKSQIEESDRIGTVRPLEAYESSLVHRHIFGSQCQLLV